ncbi:MAG: hypothetical protein GX129_02400 [Clostridiales bacterium]|nr:hypothetical protein [Clostridiales bacterium]
MSVNFPFNTYIAIIGDIKASKKLSDRSEVQKKLNNVLSDINDKYKNDIYSKFTITLGDEFQGLLCNGKSIMSILSEIERRVYPIKIRIGVGIGGITTDINRDISIGADGPAYYNARKAINYLKEDERKKQTNPADIRFEILDGYDELTMLLNTTLTLMTVIKEAWTERQREIIWDMLEHQDNQIEVAKRIGITQPTVQKSLSKGKYYAYKEAYDTIGQVFKEIRRRDA